MLITVRDLMQLELLKPLQLVAGASGTGHGVSKIGILDYEFSQRGSLYNPAGHWAPGEFVLTSMAYARDNPALLTDAVKKLQAVKTSGIAIKNIYSLAIPLELKQFADRAHYPLFVFTNNDLFFENIIIGVHDYLSLVQDHAAMERALGRLLSQDLDSAQIVQTAQQICPSIRSRFSTAYFLPRQSLSPEKLNMIFWAGRDVLGSGSAVVPYRAGFFYLRSYRPDQGPADAASLPREAARQLNLSLEQFSIGISQPQYFLANFKKSLQHSYWAALHSCITHSPFSDYDRIGLYKLLLSHQDDPVYLDYYERLMAPLAEYDAQNRAELIDTLLTLETCRGNINAVAQQLHIHGNTIRYRLKKAAELTGLDQNMEDFIQQIDIAVKLHRIKQSLDPSVFA